MEMSLGRLIHQRMQELGIGRAELARRMGKANTPKDVGELTRFVVGTLRWQRACVSNFPRGWKWKLG